MASEKITAIIEELKGLTVLELSELVHAVEDELVYQLLLQLQLQVLLLTVALLLLSRQSLM